MSIIIKWLSSLTFITNLIFFFINLNLFFSRKNSEARIISFKKNVEKDSKDLNIKKKELEDQSKVLSQQSKLFSQQIESNLKKEKIINLKLSEIEDKIFQISNMTEDEAKQNLFDKVSNELKDELNLLASKQIRSLKENLHCRATEIICSSIERYSSDISFSKTVDYLIVNDKKTVSRIIGKDGRNIIFFRKLTGTDIIIDKDKSDKKIENGIVIEISCFESLRREIALQTLKKMIANEKKITPLYIERIFGEISAETENIIFQSGEKVLEELLITGVEDGLTRSLGKLKYRTSYGQNVLEHCLEVAKISGTIAAEIGLNSIIAKRAGLFHDIGKSTEDLTGSSHVTSGIMLAKKYNESEIVINAIASHHDRILANNPYSLIVAAADTLSASRPGARSNQMESYISRMKNLEEISKDFAGVKKVYSFQAGREIWVIIDSNKVNDFQCLEISRKIRKSIQEKVIIPGDVTISVIREKRITEKIVNSGRNSQNNENFSNINERKKNLNDK